MGQKRRHRVGVNDLGVVKVNRRASDLSFHELPGGFKRGERDGSRYTTRCLAETTTRRSLGAAAPDI